MSGKDIDLKEYLDAGYRSDSSDRPRTGRVAAQQDWLLDFSNRRYTSMVDLAMSLILRDKARPLGSDVSVRYVRDLRPNDFKNGNVILLGSQEPNPWDELFHEDMNFVLEDDYKTTFTVRNQNPRKDEPARWVSIKGDPQRRVYGLVAYVPNVAGDGNALLLEGTGMSGTQAASDLVCSDEKLMPFLWRILRRDGTLPHFELLLEEEHGRERSPKPDRCLAF